MPGRNFNSNNYKYGFNGKEKDDEGLGGGGSTYDYGFRIYNPSLGKFLSTDPLSREYPWYTPYQFAGNMPIIAIDMDGLEEWIVIRAINFRTKAVITTVKYNAGHVGEGVQYNFVVANRNTGGSTNIGTLTLPDFIKGTRDKGATTVKLKYYSSQDDAKKDADSKKDVLGANGINLSQGKYDSPTNTIKEIYFTDQVTNLTETYDTDKSAPSKSLIDYSKVADFLIANPILQANINGYTDSQDTDEHNKKLSTDRALKVKNEIVNAAKGSNKYSSQQIEDLKSRISTYGNGECEAKEANGDNVEDPKYRNTTINITGDNL